jgi:hypothetical protein
VADVEFNHEKSALNLLMREREDRSRLIDRNKMARKVIIDVFLAVNELANRKETTLSDMKILDATMEHGGKMFSFRAVPTKTAESEMFEKVGQ